MTQDELWITKWNEIFTFMKHNKRRPSKHRPEEMRMHNWWKHNKKLMNAGKLSDDRKKLFVQLLQMGEDYKHVNQYE